MVVDGLNSANDNDDVKLEKYIANCILNKSVVSGFTCFGNK